MSSRPRTPASRPPAQGGAALITAMVFLLILTIIGLSAISTTSLEQKMATNLQETNRAFEAAESGLSKVFNTAGTLDLYSAFGSSFVFGTAKSEVETNFQGWSNPPRGSGYSAVQFTTAHFWVSSAATTDSGATTVLQQGISQMALKP